MNLEYLNKLILGTVQLGIPYGINNTSGKPNPEEAFRILSYGIESGIKVLDTAMAYGDAIEIIGRFHREGKYRYEVISKVKDLHSGDISDVVSQMCENLYIDRLYTLLLHKFEDIYIPNISDVLQKLKEQHLTHKIGISVYTNEQISIASNKDWIDVIQVPFNALDNENARGKFILEAKEKGKIIHTRSAFLQGLFFKEEKQIPDNLISLCEPINKLKEISLTMNVTYQSMLLQYVMSKQNIDGVLIGVETKKQLEENISSLDISINKEVFATIDTITVAHPELLLPINWQN